MSAAYLFKPQIKKKYVRFQSVSLIRQVRYNQKGFYRRTWPEPGFGLLYGLHWQKINGRTEFVMKAGICEQNLAYGFRGWNADYMQDYPVFPSVSLSINQHLFRMRNTSKTWVKKKNR